MKTLLQKVNARGTSLQTSVVAVDQAIDAVIREPHPIGPSSLSRSITT
jgi:hypothetical protein